MWGSMTEFRDRIKRFFDRVQDRMKRSRKRVQDRMKRFFDTLYKKSNIIYAGIIAIGIALLYEYTSEGVAFIISGFVGLVMSFITTDVAQSIKTEIRTDGEKTRTILNDMNGSMKDMNGSMKEMIDVLKKIEKKQS